MSTTLKFKRSRSNRTNYRFRLKTLLSHKPRLVVRPSSRDVTVQLVEYNAKGDAVRVTVRASNLRKLGWQYGTGNVPAAYLCGYFAGIKAKKAGIKQAVLDIGGQISVGGSRIYAVVKGALDAGLEIPCSPEVLPSDERVSGKHIEAYASAKVGHAQNQFSQIKAPLAKLSESVEALKNKIKDGSAHG